MPDWLRPHGIIINGALEQGLEISIHDGVVQDIRSATGPSEQFVLSPAFVNAHSHFEYRGMLDQIPHPEYYEWIYELARLKPLETPEFVREQCRVAAMENRRSGVAWVGEHSDRMGSVEAMVAAGLGGWVFHEVITSGSPDIPATLGRVRSRVHEFFDSNGSLSTTSRIPTTKDIPLARGIGGERTVGVELAASINPHAYFTVDRDILRQFGASGDPLSIHVAETIHESNFTRTGTGPLADRRRSFGVPFDIFGQSVVEVLDELGMMRPGVQCVHCCDVDANDIDIFAKRGVTIAHCPRSNVRLQCPTAPIREFLDAGIRVGLGMDSPASGGKIDMFAEMRSALIVSHERGAPLTVEEVWRMATSEGYKSFGRPTSEAWDIYVGASTPLIRIESVAEDTMGLVANGRPDLTSFVG